MFRISDLRHKDIINSNDGKRLGFIKDFEMDIVEGRITAIILPGENRMFSFFGKGDDLVVGWEQVKKIGVDVVLVDLPTFANPKQKEERPAGYAAEWPEHKKRRYSHPEEAEEQRFMTSRRYTEPTAPAAETETGWEEKERIPWERGKLDLQEWQPEKELAKHGGWEEQVEWSNPPLFWNDFPKDKE